MAIHAIDGPKNSAVSSRSLSAAIGADVEPPPTIAIGMLFVIFGADLLVWKIIRRNEGGPVV